MYSETQNRDVDWGCSPDELFKAQFPFAVKCSCVTFARYSTQAV